MIRSSSNYAPVEVFDPASLCKSVGPVDTRDAYLSPFAASAGVYPRHLFFVEYEAIARILSHNRSAVSLKLNWENPGILESIVHALLIASSDRTYRRN